MSSYADTSFLVSLYTPDVNSLPAAELMRSAKLPLMLTPWGELELLNALQLRLFRNELGRAQVKAAASLVRKDLDAGIYALKPLSPAAFEKAKDISRRITRRLGNRTLDILHVASALVLEADAFYSFDIDQRKLAQMEGLSIV